MMVKRSPSVRGPRHFARSVSLQRRNLTNLGLITGIAALGLGQAVQDLFAISRGSCASFDPSNGPMPQKISPGRNGRGKLGKWIVAAPSPGGKAGIGGCDRIVRKSPPLPAKQHPKVNTASQLPLCARSSFVQELRVRALRQTTSVSPRPLFRYSRQRRRWDGDCRSTSGRI